MELPRIDLFSKDKVAKGHVLTQRLIKRMNEIPEEEFKSDDRRDIYEVCIEKVLSASIEGLKYLSGIKDDKKLIKTLKNGQFRNK